MKRNTNIKYYYYYQPNISIENMKNYEKYRNIKPAIISIKRKKKSRVPVSTSECL